MMGTAEFAPGAIVDGWKVIKTLRKGGFGAVHKVEKNGQERALKLALHGEDSGDVGRTHARTLREVALLLMLDHPNIIKPRAFGYLLNAPAGHVYYVMDYVEGWTLGEWLERMCPTAREIARVFMKIAAALAYLHSRGTLHRDLKLSNVIIRKRDGEPILIDLGCATHPGAEELTETPLPPGTRGYRSPEAQRFLEEQGQDPQARYPYQVADELFAMGVMLYELLTDPQPTKDRPRPSFTHPVFPPPAPREVNPRVPDGLSALVEELLARDAVHRPESFGVLSRKLEELAEHQEPEYDVPVHPPTARPPPAPGGGWALSRWRKLLPWAGLMTALALLAGASAWLLWAQPPVPPSPRVRDMIIAAPILPSPRAALAPRPLPAPAPSTAQKEGSTMNMTKLDAPPPGRASRPSKSLPTPGARRTPAWCKSVALSLAMASGCTGAQLRPDPFECPPGARDAMARLGWEVGDILQILIDDRGPPGYGSYTFRPGPVVGLIRPDGNRHLRYAKNYPAGTRLFGRLYLAPTQESHLNGFLIAVYNRAKLPGQEEVPVCLVVDNELLNTPPKDGAAEASTLGEFRVVHQWP